jgi:hypothetical protein
MTTFGSTFEKREELCGLRRSRCCEMSCFSGFSTVISPRKLERRYATNDIAYDKTFSSSQGFSFDKGSTRGITVQSFPFLLYSHTSESNKQHRHTRSQNQRYILIEDHMRYKIQWDTIRRSVLWNTRPCKIVSSPQRLLQGQVPQGQVQKNLPPYGPPPPCHRGRFHGRHT